MTNSQNPQPFLSLHTAVVLLIAFVIGVIMGVLAALAGAPVPAAVAAGITSAGATVVPLRSLVR
ncbi:hypothetical protein [Streptomyces sp. NPDC093094]|uniref:hypothetical protein n=1 Tax=Streptomyces sp. NPDC093094 TaxID=3366026 RepID=UPI003813F80A